MGAQQNCDGCRSWVEDIYWTHFQFLHFAQFLRTDYEQHLALPKTFSDNLKKKLPENVSLKGPGGVVWNIGLTTRDDTLYFTHGWEQFVKDHSLKENDFLVFKYNGESLFDVLIFDGESFCEKAASYFVRKCGHAEHGGGCSSKRRDTDNSVDEVNTPSNGGVECVSPDKSVHLNSVQVPFAVPCETPNEKTYNGGVESACAEQFMADAVPEQFVAEPVTDTEAVAVPVPSQTIGKRISRSVYAVKPVQHKRRGRPPKASNSRERALNWVTESETASGGKSGSGSPELYISNRRPVTENEIKNTLQMAQAACTNDSVHVTMRPSHVYKRFFVSMPNKWILNHLSPTSQDVILRHGNGEWVAKYSFHNIRQNGGLSGGWKRFVLDNNLEEFDVCVFKQAGHMSGTLIMNVDIFRVVEETIPPTPVKTPGKKSNKKKVISAI
ncbi:DNA-binding barrel domain superfamily [Sesbania bispinosa]|nr:DNA-binding barrel domain superfamily [Sesbania bispinosa]